MEKNGHLTGIKCEFGLWSKDLHSKNKKIRVILCFKKMEAIIIYPNDSYINTDLIKNWINDTKNYNLDVRFVPIKSYRSTKTTITKLESGNGNSKTIFLSELLNFLSMHSKIFEKLSIKLLSSQLPTT